MLELCAIIIAMGQLFLIFRQPALILGLSGYNIIIMWIS
jgi:hypothetical protein